jgi:ParB family chromosome partitioning protein
MPWRKSKQAQLDLLDIEPEPSTSEQVAALGSHATTDLPETAAIAAAGPGVRSADGRPMFVAISLLYEDADNPRTEFPDAEIDELADDIRRHGILQPMVVHPADAQGRFRIHFGAKRWRAAQRAGLSEVPVVVRDAPADPYAQVAENQKRHGLTPLDLARFIKGRADAGESNATIANRLGMNLTTVAHHLSLLELPPVLDEALKSGRCTSPRTLHELSKLHDSQPDAVRELLTCDADITRTKVATMRSAKDKAVPASAPQDLVALANEACERLERSLARIDKADGLESSAGLLALRQRISTLAARWSKGSDRQTPNDRGQTY